MKALRSLVGFLLVMCGCSDISERRAIEQTELLLSQIKHSISESPDHGVSIEIIDGEGVFTISSVMHFESVLGKYEFYRVSNKCIIDFWGNPVRVKRVNGVDKIGMIISFGPNRKDDNGESDDIADFVGPVFWVPRSK